MRDLLTIGETMAAFASYEKMPLRYAHNFGMRIAGAESNTAMGLAKLGFESSWVSKVGDDEFGAFIVNQIRSEGVDTSSVVKDKEHSTGVMFKETTAGETRVYYYRENSAASHMTKDDISEDLIKQFRMVHMSGITPILSPECMELTNEVFRIAKENNIKISFDPNIRKKLWKDRCFVEEIRSFVLQANIILIGLDEAEVLFQTKDHEAIFDILFQQGCAEYVGLKDGANGSWVADKETYIKVEPHACKCIDPIGAGDAYNSGFIAAVLKGSSLKAIGKMASVSGALATETTGDIEGYPSKEHMDHVLNHTDEIYR